MKQLSEGEYYQYLCHYFGDLSKIENLPPKKWYEHIFPKKTLPQFKPNAKNAKLFYDYIILTKKYLALIVEEQNSLNPFIHPIKYFQNEKQIKIRLELINGAGPIFKRFKKYYREP
ncbi:MAG: hypothetical protein NTW67_04980 [Candidatus Woesearchaeota archaeon]|nr:hypothetical protein [Candidatus Woesearchaeota archaeon]